MKVIIAGGRDFCSATPWINLIQSLVHNRDIDEIVSGCCSGADKFGEDMANFLGLKITRFPAEWAKYGKSAGPKRNRKMAEYADACILLPGGIGTDNMRNEAKKAGIEILYDARDAK